jgi:hypothetical protein
MTRWLRPTHRRGNPDGLSGEGPVEHLKNALTILVASQELGEKDAMDATDVSAVIARIRKAVSLLEHQRVNTPLSRHPHRRSIRRSNPALAILGNPRVVDADRVLWAKIEYVRPDDPDTEDGSGKDIIRVHEFPDGVDIGWLSDGSVQLSHPSKKLKLWMDDKND